MIQISNDGVVYKSYSSSVPISYTFNRKNELDLIIDGQPYQIPIANLTIQGVHYATPALALPALDLILSDGGGEGLLAPANPSGAVGFAAVNGAATTYMRSDAAPALDPTILTQTGEANKIPQLDNGGTLVLQNATQRIEYGPASIFAYGPNASWLDIDASGMEIDLIGGGTTIHMGLDGINAANQPITTSHTATQANEVVNKSLLDSTLAGVVGGLTYKGSWDAATNTPTLADGVGTNGDLYKVSVAGSQDLGGGTINFEVGDHVVYVAGDNMWENFGASAPVPANPTVTVGLTAKNGTSPNFMRADAAPAIDQAIVPTWSGIHTFNGSTGSGVPSIVLGDNNPELRFNAANSDADTRRWVMQILGGGAGAGTSTFRFAPLKDNGTGKNGVAPIVISADTTKLISTYLNTATRTIRISEGVGSVGPGIWSDSGATAWFHTGPFYASGSVGAGATADRPSPTNTGTLIVSAPNVADVQFFDSSHTVDNRTAEWIYFQNKLQARFKNDAGSAAVVPLAFAGGQATGITGITSDSGSGAWLHQGSFGFTGPLLANGQTGTPGQRLTSTGNATPPAWTDNFPAAVAADGKTAQAANINTPSLYAVPTSGMYRVSAFLVVSQAATTSSVLPGCSVSYTEATTGVVVQDIITLSANTNTLGLHVGGSAIICAQQGSNIGYVTSNYASAGATPMQYAVRIKVEFLG